MKMVFCAAKQENRPFGKEYAMEYQDGMDRDTFEILDDLRSTIEEAKGAFGNRQQCQIDREDLLGLLEELEAVLPEDIRNATTIVRRREEILARAEDDAARIIEDARMQAETLASEQEIVRIARIQHDEILAAAEQYDRDIREGANDYADDVFYHIERELDGWIENVRGNRERFVNISEQ